MKKHKRHYFRSKYYGYFINGHFVILEESFKNAKQIVQTIADIEGFDIVLYHFNFNNQIFWCTFIKSCKK